MPNTDYADNTDYRVGYIISEDSRDDSPFVTLRSTDMTVGKSVPAFPVEHFCKLVRF